MNKDKSISFKYKSTYLFNMVALLFFILYIIIIFVIIKFYSSFFLRILLLILAIIFILLWMYFVGKKLCVLNGKFNFNKNDFEYITMRKTYIINYNEIESITKENYIDNSKIISIENMLFRLKIKNSGSFVFCYYDSSLIDAIKKLTEISKNKINDQTK